ncbi:MAG: single-stranded-DNA-specific exonuclease RecJ, partial [Myxococcales bacterium FL481]
MEYAAPSLARRGRADLADADCQGLAEELREPRRCVELLVSRGVTTPADMRRCLAPRLADLRPPADMAGFAQAVELTSHAIDRQARFGVFGDYDVDGVTTASILSIALESFGASVVASVARRDEGYGLTLAAARRFHEAGVSTLLVGDCGTSDHEALAWLAARGVTTVVIDHHQVPHELPPATALINPHRRDCRFAFKGLCSGGVAFYLAAALRTSMRRRGRGVSFEPRAVLDLAALATVCDMVPLQAENRVIVRHGLEQMRRQLRPGIAAMLARSKVRPGPSIDEEHLSFQLGPRINAAGRLGSAMPAFELLRSRAAVEASPLADRIESLNARRRELQRGVELEAQAQLETDPARLALAGLVVAERDWPAGVVGIVAASLTERYQRPAVVIAIDEAGGVARGSARSWGPIDVRQALADSASHLTRFGGHPAAAGVTLRPDQIPAFAEAFA